MGSFVCELESCGFLGGLGGNGFDGRGNPPKICAFLSSFRFRPLRPTRRGFPKNGAFRHPPKKEVTLPPVNIYIFFPFKGIRPSVSFHVACCVPSRARTPTEVLTGLCEHLEQGVAGGCAVLQKLTRHLPKALEAMRRLARVGARSRFGRWPFCGWVTRRGALLFPRPGLHEFDGCWGLSKSEPFRG